MTEHRERLKRYDFREFLLDKFAEQYAGLDDDMPDSEADWFMNLDVEEVIDYAEKWHKKCVSEIEAIYSERLKVAEGMAEFLKLYARCSTWHGPNYDKTMCFGCGGLDVLTAWQKAKEK